MIVKVIAIIKVKGKSY